MMYRVHLLFSALVLPGLARGEEAPAVTARAGGVNASAAPELFSAGYLAQVLGSLVVVFLCLFAVVYMLKRFNSVGVGSGSALRVLGSASVGQREKVVLLEVGNEQLLLGVAQGSVRTLHVLPEPVIDSKADSGQTQNFAAVLRAANPLGGRS